MIKLKLVDTEENIIGEHKRFLTLDITEWDWFRSYESFNTYDEAIKWCEENYDVNSEPAIYDIKEDILYKFEKYYVED